LVFPPLRIAELPEMEWSLLQAMLLLHQWRVPHTPQSGVPTGCAPVSWGARQAFHRHTQVLACAKICAKPCAKAAPKHAPKHSPKLACAKTNCALSLIRLRVRRPPAGRPGARASPRRRRPTRAGCRARAPCPRQPPAAPAARGLQVPNRVCSTTDSNSDIRPPPVMNYSCFTAYATT